MPTSVLTRGRKIVARLTALAMVASIMVIGALPASAEIDTSATCPSSTPSAGFTDIAGQPAHTQLAINCIADYEIAQGFTATTFVPQAEVSRWQMALFLTRQATVHGLTLGNGSDQGFTDIAEYPAATRTAINQLAQLNITQGTTATTYSPAAPVTRWQMALFLTRLLSAAGVTLGDGSDQGFTDIAAFPASTQVAINQIAQAEVSEGFSATTYGPAQNTLRSQMALFLTRTLAADGITPAISAQFTFNPSGAVDVPSGDEQAFTVSGLTAGDEYQIAQIDANEVTVTGSQVVFGDNEGTANEADNLGNEATVSAAITEVNGVGITAALEATATANSSGQLTLEVESDVFSSFYLVVFIDDDGDKDLELNSDNMATEDFGLSGLVSILAAEAPTGHSDTTVEVLAVGDGYFVGDDGTNIYTYFRDSGDDTEYDGVNTSSANFDAWLTPDTDDHGGDIVDVTSYSRTAGSTFDITTDFPNAPTNVTAVAGDFDASSGDTDDDDVRVRWTAADGGNVADYSVALYEEDDDDDTDCWDGVLEGAAVLDSNDTAPNDDDDLEVIFVDVAFDEYCAVVTAISGTGDNSDESADADAAIVTVDSGDGTAPTIIDLDLDADTTDPGLLGNNDVIVFTFSEAMDVDIASGGSFFRVRDDDSQYQVTCGGTTATCVLSDSDNPDDVDDVLTVTLTDAPTFISGEADGIDFADVPTVTFTRIGDGTTDPWTDVAGVDIDLAGSADVTIN